jgi:prevent-host-death family protein
MREQEPLTQTIKASQARQAWSHLLEQVFRRETRVVVEQDGIPVAAIVSTQDLERLQQLEQQRQRDLATLRASQARFQDEPADEVERQLAQALAEVRAERSAAKGSPARSV